MYGWDDFNFEGESFTDVQPACDEPRPVMVHSHGDQSVGWEMFFLHEFAATHGWLVLAMDHPGNTLYGSSQDYGELFSQRPADVMDAYDWLVTESADPGSPLSGCVDESDGYVATGYSFGGYTAYATSGALVNGIEGRETLDHSDDRVTAVVTFAPWNASGSLSTGTSAITVPVLTLGADRDERVGTQYQDLFSSVTAIPRVLGGFVNAGHLSFAAIYCFVPGDGCGPDYHAIEDFETRVRTATLAFLGHARGQTGAIEQLPAADEELVWEMVLE